MGYFDLGLGNGPASWDLHFLFALWELVGLDDEDAVAAYMAVAI